MGRKKYMTHMEAADARRARQAQYMRERRAGAPVVLPSILLDNEHAAYLQTLLDRGASGPSAAVRGALKVAAADATKRRN